jgi:hypothetical protein
VDNINFNVSTPLESSHQPTTHARKKSICILSPRTSRLTIFSGHMELGSRQDENLKSRKKRNSERWFCCQVEDDDDSRSSSDSFIGKIIFGIDRRKISRPLLGPREEGPPPAAVSCSYLRFALFHILKLNKSFRSFSLHETVLRRLGWYVAGPRQLLYI